MLILNLAPTSPYQHHNALIVIWLTSRSRYTVRSVAPNIVFVFCWSDTNALTLSHCPNMFICMIHYNIHYNQCAIARCFFAGEPFIGSTTERAFRDNRHRVQFWVSKSPFPYRLVLQHALLLSSRLFHSTANYPTLIPGLNDIKLPTSTYFSFWLPPSSPPHFISTSFHTPRFHVLPHVPFPYPFYAPLLPPFPSHFHILCRLFQHLSFARWTLPFQQHSLIS